MCPLPHALQVQSGITFSTVSNRMGESDGYYRGVNVYTQINKTLLELWFIEMIALNGNQ